MYTTIADNYLYVATARQGDGLPAGAENVVQLKDGAVFGIPAGSRIPDHWAEDLRNTKDGALIRALDAGDRFVRFDEQPWNQPAMEHGSGCAYFRQRPCTCVYLRSWKPAPDSRLAGPGILLMPKDMVRVTIPTPQNRDAARRAGLTKGETRGKLLSEKDIQKLRDALPLRTGLMARSASTYVTDHPKEFWEQMARDWQKIAESRKSSLYYLGSFTLATSAAAISAIGQLVGWW
jgi:hypothetical protein